MKLLLLELVGMRKKNKKEWVERKWMGGIRWNKSDRGKVRKPTERKIDTTTIIQVAYVVSTLGCCFQSAHLFYIKKELMTREVIRKGN